MGLCLAADSLGGEREHIRAQADGAAEKKLTERRRPYAEVTPCAVFDKPVHHPGGFKIRGRSRAWNAK